MDWTRFRTVSGRTLRAAHFSMSWGGMWPYTSRLSTVSGSSCIESMNWLWGANNGKRLLNGDPTSQHVKGVQQGKTPLTEARSGPVTMPRTLLEAKEQQGLLLPKTRAFCLAALAPTAWAGGHGWKTWRRGQPPAPTCGTPALYSLQNLVLVLNLGHHLPKQLGLLLTAQKGHSGCGKPVSQDPPSPPVLDWSWPLPPTCTVTRLHAQPWVPVWQRCQGP